MATHCVPGETLARNASHSRTLGLPMLGEARHPFLAVVGGGPSVKDHIDELKSWPGAIWAINGACDYLRGFGIRPRFFSTDPLPGIADLVACSDSAILATWCDPAAFAAARNVELVDIEDCPRGPTTASNAPYLAAQCGFRSVHFFGCESSFGETTHAYDVDRGMNMLRVVCNGREFLTSPQMMMQAEYLGEILRSVPVYRDRSGGLLSAVIADPEIDVIAASRSVYDAAMKGAA